MASEGLQRRIDRLLDEADDAISKYDWEAVSRDAHAFLAIDPEHSGGLTFLATAERALATLAPNPASDSGTTTTTEASISTLGTPEHTELPPPVIGASKADRRQLTVRFCDLQSPKVLSQQLDLEELRGVIRSYQDVCAGAVVRFDGYVAKYLGDGLDPDLLWLPSGPRGRPTTSSTWRFSDSGRHGEGVLRSPGLKRRDST